MKALIIDLSEHREHSVREEQRRRSEYLRQLERIRREREGVEAGAREGLRDADWETLDQGLRPLPTLVMAMVGALIWGGFFYFLV